MSAETLERMKGVLTMAPHAVVLCVHAPVEVECKFWAEDDVWIGTAEQLAIRLQAASFEDAKKSMEGAIAQYLERLLAEKTGARTSAA
jgi:hypothetical protein